MRQSEISECLTAVILGRQGCLAMQTRFLANSTNAAAPILVYNFVLDPGLFLLFILDILGLYLGGRSRAARRGRYGMVATNARARICRGGPDWRGSDRVLVLRHILRKLLGEHNVQDCRREGERDLNKSRI